MATENAAKQVRDAAAQVRQAAEQVRENGVAHLRGAFATDALARLKEAAALCFAAIETGRAAPERYRFNRSSHSVLLTALTDFGCDDVELTAPLAVPELDRIFSEAVGGAWRCNMEQSWVRKKFAPRAAPAREYHPHSWHQDGALGVRFPTQPGPAVPMTELLTCWIPLDACGKDSPGLEFVRRRLGALLHFTELEDAAVRRRFAAREFWAPELEFGDGIVFLNGTLHRTYARDEMHNNRLSVEYRIFPR